MAIFRPFKALRPPKNIADKVAAKPYDVINTQEARKEAEGNPYSLLHITRSEIDLPVGTDEHDPRVYEKAKENFLKFIENKWLIPDNEAYFYIYAQTMWGKTQYGIVGCASIDDYFNNVIKKHELTRKDKEEDRMKHVRVTNANVEPVFFAYKSLPELDNLILSYAKEHEPIYDFTANDGVGHHFWVINEKEINEKIQKLFAEMPALYVADGHHRTAAAALVGKEKREQHPNYTGDEEFNYFMAVAFPDNQLTIIDYNRVVKDLNGLSKDEFLQKLSEFFDIENKGTEEYKPNKLHNFSMYLGGNWYSLTAKKGTYNDNDPIGVLDVTILSDLVLNNLLGIKDLRTDKRIDFVGGIRGLGELKRRVDSGEMTVAFALYPVSMKQLMDIADSGNIMPPKTTWFEPKLRSGLSIHLLD
ncbi:MAG TPA: DUF1015 family protein [Bacteroidales bacterium]|jgi:uncharacterized protein (DUF1015 family)|nr:DUF1015 family protein [Bacteroidales bacterium]HOS20006.1 DUF1015 family protein [Bacteroidales bacterium]HPM39619.1 DUF1015 family protein [Bacteroidales bacterium]HPX46129.1 DUF1015 family protein [Bacteroidales bacterium]HQE77651.1 DUF1015 family protein [Bacteroidales bacterium]